MPRYAESLAYLNTDPSLKCKSKAEVTSAKFARCTNPYCKMLQKVDMAKETLSAIVVITTPSIADKEVHIFEAELRKIVDADSVEVTEEELLESCPFSCCVNAKNVLANNY